MTTKDKDMSEQSNERELFEASNPPEKGVEWDNVAEKYFYNIDYWINRDEGALSRLQSYNENYRLFRSRAPLLARIAELEGKLEAAEKDAARYRFIRPYSFIRPLNVVSEDLDPLNDDELDAAVDSAMQRRLCD